MLELRGLTKTFPGVVALDAVDFDLRASEVHALVGENGAGKSTLIEVVAGAQRADSGRIVLQGRTVVIDSPRRAHELGIAVIHQQPTLLPDLSVAENLWIGSDGAWIDQAARRRRSRALLDRVGARLDPGSLAGDASLPQQQLLEIARALRSAAPVLILDEPTAALGEADAERLLGLLDELRTQGVAMLYVSHRLDEVLRIADRITVLRDGRRVITADTADLDRESLIRHMVGHDVERIGRHSTAEGRPRLTVSNLTSAAARVQVDELTVCEHEIHGLAGLVGAGRSELAELIVGLRRTDAGTVTAERTVYVPEDRRRHGVIAGMSVAANISLPKLGKLTRRGLIDARAERDLALRSAEAFGIKASSHEADVATLSGGNQQKVVLARWLACDPRVVILDEPTQGIDVASREQIHRLIRDLADRGLAVLLISSDLDELLELSDRISVMRDGRIAGELDAATATRERLLALAISPGVRA